jgi:4-amino-4-deoxy-L-arabinose transferase-like glycosyltransferase
MREKNLLLLFLGVGILIRIFLWLTIGYKDLASDTLSYIAIARAFFQDFGTVWELLLFSPGYSVLFGLVAVLVQDYFISAKIVSFVLGVATIPLAYVVGKKLSNKKSGLFAAFAFAIYPGITQASVVALTEGPFIFFFLLAIYTFLEVLDKGSWKSYLLSGLIVAICFLIRPEGIFLVVSFLLLTAYNFFKSKSLNLFKVVAFFLVFFLVLSPYIIFIHNETGMWSLSGKGGVNLIKGEVLTMSEEEWRETYTVLNEDKTKLLLEELTFEVKTLSYIKENFEDFVDRYWIHVVEETRLLFYLMIPVLIPLLLYFFFRHRKKIVAWIMLVYCGMILLIYPMYTLHPRYLFILAAPLILIAAVGYGNMKAALKRLKLLRYSEGVRIFSIFVLVLVSCLYLYSVHLDKGYYVSYGQGDFDYSTYEKMAGEILILEETSEAPYIISLSAYLSYYTNGYFVTFPYAYPDELLEYAENRGVDYIFVNEKEMSSWVMYEELSSMGEKTCAIEVVRDESTGYLLQVFSVADCY